MALVMKGAFAELGAGWRVTALMKHQRPATGETIVPGPRQVALTA